MEENSGLWLGYAFLLVWVAGIIGAITGTLDDFIVWVFGEQFIHDVLAWGAIVIVVAVVVFFARRGKDNVGFASGATHSHFVAGGDKARDALQKHEDAHQKVTSAVGGGGSTVHIWPEKGGWRGRTVFHDPYKVAALSPEKKVAIAMAGLIAAPDTTSDTDKPHARDYAGEADNPGAAMRKGKSIARRIV